MADPTSPRGWVPPRGVLLHIGPHKTGTTAIQGALAAARPALSKRGISYPGDGGQHRMPALAITGARGVVGLRPPKQAEWDRLVSDVHAARRKRVVVSAEAFVEADDAIARRIITELGAEKVQVVMTLRPLAKILPSAWQQMVRNRVRSTYDDWLDQVLNQESTKRAIVNFWHRHRHEAVVERWSSIVGPARMAIVVASDVDRLALIRSFETLLDLPQDFLVTTEARDNRGLTASEIELIRQLNLEFHDRGWSSELYHQVVRLGGVMGMQTRPPEPGEPKIITPAWAVERANEIAAQSADWIRASGVLVMGDLDSLSAVTADPAPEPGANQVLVDAARRKALDGVAAQLESLRNPPPPDGNARPVESIATVELAAIVRQRITRRVSAKLGLGFRRY